jgi:phosphoribosylformylglycinamidine synthase
MKKYRTAIKVTLRPSILDVQGKAVEHALHSLDYDMMSEVRIGKYIELEIEAQNDGQAEAFALEASKKLLANPVIEDYQVEILDND